MMASKNKNPVKKHSYWGIGCLLSALAGLACMIIAAANVWPTDCAPLILMFLFLLLADMCAHRVIDGQAKK